MALGDECLLKVCLWNGSQKDKANRRIAQELLRRAPEFGIFTATGMPMTEGGGVGQIYRSAAIEASASQLPLVLRFYEEKSTIQKWARVCADWVGGYGIVTEHTSKAWPPKLKQKAPDKAHSREKNALSGGDGMTEDCHSLFGQAALRVQTLSALEVEVYTTEAMSIDGKPVYQLVVDWAKAQGVLWVSVERAGFGYGALRMWSRDGRRKSAPILITMIDREDSFAKKIPALAAKLAGDAVVVAKPVTWYQAKGE